MPGGRPSTAGAGRSPSPPPTRRKVGVQGPAGRRPSSILAAGRSTTGFGRPSSPSPGGGAGHAAGRGAHKKSIPEQTKRVMKIPRPPLDISARRIQIPDLVEVSFELLFSK